MKTLVITGSAPLPAALREVLERGSTSIEERKTAELAQEAVHEDADRVVFWACEGDAAAAALAQKYATSAAAEGREKLVYVTPDPAVRGLPGLAPNELFVWPRDEDRLKMAFMTSA